MSFVASSLTFLLWMVRTRRLFESEKAVSNLSNNRMIVSKAPSKVPSWLSRKYQITEQEMTSATNWTILTIKGTRKEVEEGKSMDMIFFHGGAFVVGATMLHWNFIDSLMETAFKRGFGGVTITMPLYGRCPENSHADFYPLMLEYYLGREFTSDRMVFIGDSAGGNLALSFALQLEESANAKGPDAIVLLSPWLDLCLENEGIKAREKEDYVLARDGLVAAGKWWAGSPEKEKHPHCSPINAKEVKQQNIHIFIGSRDILEPDCILFASKFPKNIRLYHYEGMFHVWMLYPVPLMPEKTRAMNEIFDIIFAESIIKS